jgi:hypothetical protein
MIEILRVIARLPGDPKVGAKEGCTKPISNSYMRRFKRSRSIRAFFCCRSLARLTMMANNEKDETIKKIGLVTS